MQSTAAMIPQHLLALVLMILCYKIDCAGSFETRCQSDTYLRIYFCQYLVVFLLAVDVTISYILYKTVNSGIIKLSNFTADNKIRTTITTYTFITSKSSNMYETESLLHSF